MNKGIPGIYREGVKTFFQDTIDPDEFNPEETRLLLQKIPGIMPPGYWNGKSCYRYKKSLSCADHLLLMCS